MPHIHLKIAKGQSETAKQQIAEALTDAITEHTENPRDAVSVRIEDIEKEDWKAEVYDPEIKPNLDKLYKKPGYSLE